MGGNRTHIQSGNNQKSSTQTQSEAPHQNEEPGFSSGRQFTREKILQLQRTIGNQAVQRLIQEARQAKGSLPGLASSIQRASLTNDRGGGYGKLKSEEETFGNNGGMRQTGAKGFVKLPEDERENKNLSPLSFVTTGTEEGVMPAELRGYDRGHIVAVASGGPNVSANVVPQHPRVNGGGAWKKFEGQSLSVAKTLDNHNTPLGVYLEIAISYAGTKDPRIPASFNVKSSLKERVKNDSKKRTRGGKNIQKNLHGNTKNKLIRQLHEVSDKDIDNKGIILTPEKIGTRQADLQQKLKAAKGKGPVDETELGPLPPTDYRPYASLEGALPGFKPENKGFTSEQIQLILAYNIKKNGQLVSDASNDRYPVLKEHGKMSRPEIDHIVPNKGRNGISGGGFNAFSNARVVSKWLNRHKEQVLSAKDKKKRLDNYYEPGEDVKYKPRAQGRHARQFMFRQFLKAERARFEGFKRKLAETHSKNTEAYKKEFAILKNAHQANIVLINRAFLTASGTNKPFDSKSLEANLKWQLATAMAPFEAAKIKEIEVDDEESEDLDDDSSIELDDETGESDDEEDDVDSSDDDEDSNVMDEDDQNDEESSEEIDVDEEEDDEDVIKEPVRKRFKATRTNSAS